MENTWDRKGILAYRMPGNFGACPSVNDCLRRGIAAAQRAAPGRQSHLQQPLPRQPSPGSDWDAEQL